MRFLDEEREAEGEEEGVVAFDGRSKEFEVLAGSLEKPPGVALLRGLATKTGGAGLKAEAGTEAEVEAFVPARSSLSSLSLSCTSADCALERARLPPSSSSGPAERRSASTRKKTMSSEVSKNCVTFREGKVGQSVVRFEIERILSKWALGIKKNVKVFNNYNAQWNKNQNNNYE